MAVRRLLLFIVLYLATISASAQAPVITETTPVVNQGKTLQFHETLSEAGTWSCSGCTGNITVGGFYTAPATVTPQQSYGGYQLLPNNHIYNTRVDALSVNSTTVNFTIASSPTGLVRSANVVTVTLSTAPPGWFTGASVTIAGANDGSFNGTFTIATLPGTCSNLCFTYSQVAGNATSGGGTANFPWISMAGTVPFNIQYAFPINYVDGSTPTQSMGFTVTSGNNAVFPISAYPGAKIEHGWLDRRNFNHDHHLLSIDERDGTFREIYQLHTPIRTTGASVTANVATLTFATDPSDLAGAALQAGDSAVTAYGFTGGDTYFNVYPVTLTAVTSNSASFALTHANASATSNGFLSTGGCLGCNAFSGVAYLNSAYGLPNSLGGSTDAAGLYLTPLELRLQEMEQAIANGTPINHAFRMTLNQGYCASSFIWPGTNFATDGGVVPFGARFRLKASFDISTFSATAQIILTALKNYGMILSDGGTGWAIQVESAPWPTSIDAAFSEIGAAGIASTNFEAVDESALMVSSTSGETTNSRETVKFTRTSDSATATVDVALMGVAVGLPDNLKLIQAGTAAQQFTAYVHGGNNNTVTWAMSPSIGTLTSGGLYTPPATQAAVASTTVTATSTDNAAIAASMTMMIFPTGSIFIRPGATAPFTDSLGHVWAPAVQPTTGGHLGCCGNLSGGPWPAVTDIAEYYFKLFPYDDAYFTFSVPNGLYRVTAKLGTDVGPGIDIDTLESQGVIAFSNQDINVAAGGTYKPVDFVLNSAVTGGVLSFVVRHPVIGAETVINALQIDRTGEAAGIVIAPNVKITSEVSLK